MLQSVEMIEEQSFVLRQEKMMLICSRCGLCCHETEMELSFEDVGRLEELGYSSDRFSTSSNGSSRRLRNQDGHCYFFDVSSKTCRVYSSRPIGCRIYPVVYIVGEGIGVDNLCPMSGSVTDLDLDMKGKILLDHLEKMGWKGEVQ